MNQLEFNLKQLAAARDATSAMSRRVRDAQARLDLTFEAQELRDAAEVYNHIRSIEQACEATVREEIIREYERTGNKKPAPGAGVRVNSKVRYIASDLKQWALEHAHFLLMLDEKKLAKMAEELDGAPLVVEDVPTATIATDLSSYLTEA